VKPRERGSAKHWIRGVGWVATLKVACAEALNKSRLIEISEEFDAGVTFDANASELTVVFEIDRGGVWLINWHDFAGDLGGELLTFAVEKAERFVRNGNLAAPTRIVGLIEAAELLDVSWADLGEVYQSDPSFPEYVHATGIGPVWRRRDIVAYSLADEAAF
jgi:hypothetical protein